MAWVRLDDGFVDHPKVTRLGMVLGHALVSIQTRAICYANRNLTDGYLSESFVKSVFDGQELVTVKTMLDQKLWDKQGSEIWVHDYLDYNLSRKEILELRAIKKKAGQAGGQARAIAERQARAIASAQAPAIAKGQAAAQRLLKPSPPTPKEVETTSEDLNDFSKSYGKEPRKLGTLVEEYQQSKSALPTTPAFARKKPPP
jgi:hypothetical protein